MANILIIDDSKSVLALLENILVSAGHHVTATTQGREGLKRVAAGQVDLVLTDMYMPEQDGMEVIREVRRVQPDLPIIAMSAKAGPLNLFSAARALGAFATLQKPFSRDELLGKVAEVLPAGDRSVSPPIPNPSAKPSP